ncbi:MAK10-like protein [Tanacetum coccineum]
MGGRLLSSVGVHGHLGGSVLRKMAECFILWWERLWDSGGGGGDAIVSGAGEKSESFSEAWTRFKDLLQKFPHHGIDLWLQVQIFYDHVNPTTCRTIDQPAGGKLRDQNTKESLALIEDLALYDNKSWNDPRDFAKPVKAISLPHDVPNASDRRLIELENQVQRLMEAHLAPKPSVQVNKIASSFLEVLAHALIYNAILDKYVESLELDKNGSAFIQGKMQKKMKDPRSFTSPFRLGDFKAFNTLANLGSCVNLIPLYLFKKLKIGLLKKIRNAFRLADGTKSYPVGIVRNVDVHIGKLKLLEDFYVIDMEKYPTCPLLVGIGFLATASAVIDCKKAKITVEEGITRSVFRVKEIDLGVEDEPYWTTLGKRETYEPGPSTDGIGRKAHLLEDKQIPSVGVFDEVIWEAFGGNTRDLDPIWEEMGQRRNLTRLLMKLGFTARGDGIEILTGAVKVSRRIRHDPF